MLQKVFFFARFDILEIFLFEKIDEKLRKESVKRGWGGGGDDKYSTCFCFFFTNLGLFLIYFRRPFSNREIWGKKIFFSPELILKSRKFVAAMN